MTHEQRNLAGRVAGAGAWTVGARLVAKLVDLALLFFLARFLEPADFGLVATAMATVFIVEALFELPLSAALVRVPDLTEEMLQTAFTLGLLRGLVVTLLLCALAWPMAVLNAEPRLTALMAALAAAPAMRGLVSPRMVEYDRVFNFRPQAVLEFSGKAVAFCVSFVLAAAFHSYWAIAAATVCGPAIVTVLSYFAAPLRPRLTLSQWPLFSNLVGWGFAVQLCSALNWQLDRLLLPKLTPVALFGQYSIAKQLTETPSQALAAPLQRPCMAALANAGAHVGDRYLQLNRAVSIVFAPAIALLVVWPEPVIRVMLGDKWLPAAPWLQWMSATMLLSLPAMLVGALCLTMDQARPFAVRNFFQLLVRVPAIWFGAVHFGVPGVIAANAIAGAAGVGASLIVVRQLARTSISAQLKTSLIPLAALIPACFFLWLVKPQVMGASTFPGLVFGVTIYACLFLFAYGLGVLGAWMLSGRPPGIERHVASVMAAFIQRSRILRRPPGRSAASGKP